MGMLGGALVNVGQLMVHVFPVAGHRKEYWKSTGIWTVINGIVSSVSGYLMLIKAWPWL